MDYFIKIITVITRYQSKKSKIGRKLWRKLPIWGKYKHMCVLYITGCPIWMGWILNSYNGFIFGVGHFQMLTLFNHKALQNIYPHPNQTPCICKQNTLPAFLFPPSFPNDVVFKLLYSIMDEITYYILYLVFATHTHIQVEAQVWDSRLIFRVLYNYYYYFSLQVWSVHIVYNSGA